MSKTDLQVFDEMVKTDNQGIAASTTVLGCDTDKRGCVVKVGVEAERGQQLMQSMVKNDKKHVAILYIVDMDEFNKIKNGK